MQVCPSCGKGFTEGYHSCRTGQRRSTVEEISHALEAEAEAIEKMLRTNRKTPTILREAARKWADFALQTFSDDLLGKALAVSTALVLFEDAAREGWDALATEDGQ